MGTGRARGDDLGGGVGARAEHGVGGERDPRHLERQIGRDQEARTRRQRVARLGRGEHGPRADHDIGAIRQLGDRPRRVRHGERDLEQGDSTFDDRARGCHRGRGRGRTDHGQHAPLAQLSQCHGIDHRHLLVALYEPPRDSATVAGRRLAPDPPRPWTPAPRPCP